MNLNETYSNTKGRNARRKTFTLSTPAHGGATNQTFVAMGTGELSQVAVGQPNNINNPRTSTIERVPLKLSNEINRETIRNAVNCTSELQRKPTFRQSIHPSKFPMYDSKKFSDLPPMDFGSFTDLAKIKERNLKKIKKNRCSMGKSDSSGMSEDFFDAFETSCLDSTSPRIKNLEKLRKLENQFIEERDKTKATLVSLKNNTTTKLKEKKKKLEEIKELQGSRLVEIDELKASVQTLKDQKKNLGEKGTFDRTYVGIMSLYTNGLLKVDNFRCTDETFCNTYHQDPGKCLRLRSLSTTVHCPS